MFLKNHVFVLLVKSRPEQILTWTSQKLKFQVIMSWMGHGYNVFGDPKVGSSRILKLAEHFLT